MNKYILVGLETLFLIVFIAIVPILLLFENSTGLVWTAIIPLVPILFLILGYSNWRNVCPLAFFSKVSQNITLFPKRKVPIWFEQNFYLFQYLLLFTSFCSRLIFLNFDNVSLAIFFVFIILSSFLINLVFTGKSWCNFFCPVGIVEKIYCGSNAHSQNLNSACSTCSACKKNCPDIDMESNYWKENENKQKSFAFYSFSGLVLGFYLYFYLYSGTYEFYFSGNWSTTQLSFFSNGFFFAPSIPLLVAVPITLATFSLLSYAFFKGLEQFLYKKKFFGEMQLSITKHRVKIIAAFVAFNIFYAFAGAPTYVHYPVAYGLFYFIVVFISAITLHREFFREESFFLQERFALKMIKNWKADGPIPTSLKEIYYTYANSNKNKKEQLNTYKETIRDLLQDGILTQDSMVFLEKLRHQMGISEKNHEKVIKSLKIDYEELFDENIEKSSEKHYQKSSYKKVIEDALNQHTELSDSYIRSLRKQFCITDEMHKEIMDEILDSNEKLYTDVVQTLKKMNALRRVHKSILSDNSREISFLKYMIRSELNGNSKELFTLLEIMYGDYIKEIEILKNVFKYRQGGEAIELDRKMLDFMDEKIANAIFALKKDFDNIKNVQELDDNKAILRYLLGFSSLDIASSALLAGMKYKLDFSKNDDFNRLLHSKNENAMELAHKVLDNSDTLSTYEEMMYLYNIPIFESVKLPDLKVLAKATKVMYFSADEYIIEQGGIGDTLYIILSGEVVVDKDGEFVNKLGSEDYFGAVALFGDIKRTASVKAKSDVKALILSKDAFKEVIYDNPQISFKLMKEIIHRLTENKKCDLVNSK